MAVNPLDHQNIYIGGRSGSQAHLHVSTNGGSSWTRIAASLFGPHEAIRAISVDSAGAGRVFLGTTAGLYRSENRGSSWAKTGAFAVSGIRINPHAANEIWASSSDSGMFFSSDAGGSWTPVNAGLESLEVNGLDWSPSVGMVYAATSSGGIFRRSTRDASSQPFLSINATAGGTTDPAPGIYPYPAGTVVTVNASPQADCRFLGWTGDAAGTASPITLTMTTDRSVMANFQRIIYAPVNFTGTKKVNRGAVVSEFINVLTWQAHPNNVGVAKYRIYIQPGTNLQLLAEVDPTTFEYRHRSVTANGATIYVIKAVNDEPREGDAATVTVR